MRLTPLLTAALLTAVPVAVTALPASAATCTAPTTKTSVAPKTVVVDATGTARLNVVVAVAHNGCALGAVEALVTSPDRSSVRITLAAEASDQATTLYSGSLDLTAAELDNADAGTWKVRTSTAWGQDAAGVEARTETPVVSSGKVKVLAAAQLSADATSAALKKGKISKGKTLTVKGTLTRARWETAVNTGYAKQRVQLQFRTPKGTYKAVKCVATKSGGAYSTTIKAVKDGCYRVVFHGSKTTAAAPSPSECINVR